VLYLFYCILIIPIQNDSLACDFTNREKIIDGINTTITLTENCFIRAYFSANSSSNNQSVSINGIDVIAIGGSGSSSINFVFPPIYCKAGDIIATKNFVSGSNVYKMQLR